MAIIGDRDYWSYPLGRSVRLYTDGCVVDSGTGLMGPCMFTLLQKMQEAFLGTRGVAKKFVDDMATAGLNFIRDATVYKAKLSASDSVAFAAGLTSIRGRIADLIREAEELKLTYEGAQKEFAGILEWVGKEVKEYLDKQSAVDCTVFMDESFTNLHKFSDAFNVSSFIPVVVGTAITHHSLLTSLQVNVSHIPLKILLLPLTADTMAASGQMVLLGYVAKQDIAIQERQAQLKLLPGRVEPTIESNSRSTLSRVKPVLDKAALMPSKKDQLEAQSSKTHHFQCSSRTHLCLQKQSPLLCHCLHHLRHRSTALLRLDMCTLVARWPH